MTRRPLLVLASTLLLFSVSGRSVTAHPTAASFVTIVAPGDGRVTVTLVADGRGLALKLSPSDAADVADGQHLIEWLRGNGSQIAARIDLRADSRSVPLALAHVEPYASRSGAVAVQLAGELPPGVRSLSWQSSLFATAYPISVSRTAPGTEAVDDYEWIDGVTRSRAYAYPLGNGVGAFDFTATVWIGFTHILPKGLDHVLFVLGLFLLATTTRALVLQISMFTVAHTLTFALASLQMVRIPAALVEPLIALSIAWIAVENIVAVRLTRGRLVAVAGFGLLHGLGFAGALDELGLIRDSLLVTLVAFNLGVELGQLTVVAAAALLLAPWRFDAAVQRRWICQPLSAAIAVTGLFWAGQRLLM